MSERTERRSEREAVVARVRYEVEWYAERGSGDIEPYKVEVVRDDLRALVAEVERLREDAARWRFYAAFPQTALMLGSTLDPNSEQDWVAECNALSDAARTTGGRDA